MRRSRLYCDQVLGVDTSCQLTGERHHYLTRVLRLAIGDHICLFNGNGEEHLYQLTRIDKTNVHLTHQEQLPSLPEPDYLIHLYLAVTRSQSMGFAIQKSVELGVYAIHPVITDYSNYTVAAANRKLSHWQSVVRAAAEQCGRAKLPDVYKAVKLEEIEILPDSELAALVPAAAAPFIDGLKGSRYSVLCLLIGPEGGFSDTDEIIFRQYGFSSFNLGPRILRTETAVATVLTLSQSIHGDLGA